MEQSDVLPENAGNVTLVNIDVNSELLEKYMEVSVSYNCTECTYTSKDQKTFYEHCLGHLLKSNTSSQASIYVCSSCFTAFNTLEETQLHLKNDHADNILGKELAESSSEIAIVVETADEKIEEKSKRGKYKVRSKEKLSCPRRYCNVSFEKEGDLEIHSQCHFGEKLFRCCHCSMLFHVWPKCALHLDQAHNIDCGLLKCDLCKVYKTWAPLKLENHMRIHGDLKTFSCKICSKAFKQAGQLRNHSVIHKDQESQPNSSKSKQCNMCFKIYSDVKSLKKHKDEVHSRLRRFVCNVCGHATARKSMLARHQRQHTGHKPMACNICSYKTADHNSLRRHLMLHAGVRLYHCPEHGCNFSTVLSWNLKRHVKTLHPKLDHIFTCIWCAFKTVSFELYIHHVSDHLTGLIKDAGGSGEVKSAKLLDSKFSSWTKDLEEVAVTNTMSHGHEDSQCNSTSPKSGTNPDNS